MTNDKRLTTNDQKSFNVLWLMAKWAPEQLWYSYLIAYAIEAVLIFLCHKVGHVKFEFGGSKSE